MKSELATDASNKQALYLMIGGFLGAGKTTSVARLAERLTQKGRKVGLITNDQGRELVDTSMLRSKGFDTEEIPGGCFCCRFNSLMEAAKKLTDRNRPDLFIAEPVGSCTDLVATVTYPLRRIYGDQFVIAPLSVIMDPVRALRVLNLEEGGRFSEKVRYIYLKQLEEADVLVINKTDLISETQRRLLRDALRDRFPSGKVFEVSSRTGKGLDEWFDYILKERQGARPAMEVDYGVYADGEALLGWYNGTMHFKFASAQDPEQILTHFARDLHQFILTEGGEVAHMKMTFIPDGGLGDIAAISLVRDDIVPELTLRLDGTVNAGRLVINVRAETAPEILMRAAHNAIQSLKSNQGRMEVALEHEEFFRPGKPVPTHRMAVPVEK